MGKFRCRACDYVFELEVKDPPKLCPNCGNDNSCDKEKSADELIKDI